MCQAADVALRQQWIGNTREGLKAEKGDFESGGTANGRHL
jgi:hypothetical protein